jgi:hypothetical protein
VGTLFDPLKAVQAVIVFGYGRSDLGSSSFDPTPVWRDNGNGRVSYSYTNPVVDSLVFAFRQGSEVFVQIRHFGLLFGAVHQHTQRSVLAQPLMLGQQKGDVTSDQIAK